MERFLIVSDPAPGVRIVTLNRPEKLNALSVPLMSQLAQVFDQAASVEQVRSVIITGNTRSFSAGADIADQQRLGREAVFGKERLQAWDAVQCFPKPLIAAVDGYVLGGGNELAMLSDIIIAGEDAQFGQPEINIGMIPGDGGTQRLVRAVGKSVAMQLILTGDPIDAKTALQIGLVSEVVPSKKLIPRAIEIAAKIATKSPLALRLAKQSILKAFESSLAIGLSHERRNLAIVFESEDRSEGMSAFLEKRVPFFKGK